MMAFRLKKSSFWNSTKKKAHKYCGLLVFSSTTLGRAISGAKIAISYDDTDEQCSLYRRL